MISDSNLDPGPNSIIVNWIVNMIVFFIYFRPCPNVRTQIRRPFRPVGVLESFVPPTGGIPPVEVPHVVRPTDGNLHPECPGGGIPGGVGG